MAQALPYHSYSFFLVRVVADLSFPVSHQKATSVFFLNFEPSTIRECIKWVVQQTTPNEDTRHECQSIASSIAIFKVAFILNQSSSMLCVNGNVNACITWQRKRWWLVNRPKIAWDSTCTLWYDCRQGITTDFRYSNSTAIKIHKVNCFVHFTCNEYWNFIKKANQVQWALNFNHLPLPHSNLARAPFHKKKVPWQ